MEKLSDKKNWILTVLSTAVIILLVTVLYQNMKINSLKKELNKIVFTEYHSSDSNHEAPQTETENRNTRSELNRNKLQAGLETGEQSSLMNERTDETNAYEEKIKKLETQIADMQSWQDYLEDTVEKQSKKEEERENMLHDVRRKSLASRLEPFIKNYGLSEEIKTKLVDLRVEEQEELQGIYTGNKITKEMSEESMAIRSRYEEETADLLSEKEYEAYKDFKKQENEWSVLSQIKRDFVSKGLNLDRQQERDLVESMYDARQEMMQKRTQDFSNGKFKGKDYSKLSQEEIMERSLEYQKGINSMYTDAAKSILSEPQLKLYKRYFDNQTDMLKKSISSFSVYVIANEDDDDDDE